MLTRLENYALGLQFALRKVRLGISSTDLVLDVGGGTILTIEQMSYVRNLLRRVFIGKASSALACQLFKVTLSRYHFMTRRLTM